MSGSSVATKVDVEATAAAVVELDDSIKVIGRLVIVVIVVVVVEVDVVVPLISIGQLR
jgi:hypothetical protein